MPLKCAAYNCVYTFTKDRKQGTSFHLIPKGPARRRQWAIAIRRKAADGGLWMPNNSSVLCSRHFPERDFDRTGQTVRLREAVTPSLFSYVKDEAADARIGGKQLLSERELERLLSKQCHRLAPGDHSAPPELGRAPPTPGDGGQSDGEARDSDSPPPSDAGSDGAVNPSRPRRGGGPDGAEKGSDWSPAPGGPGAGRVTRASLRVGRLPVEHGPLSPGRGHGKPGEASVAGRGRPTERTAAVPDHPYSQRPGTPSSEDEDDPPEAGDERSRSLSPSPPLTAPPLQLPAGRLTQYMVDVTAKRQQIRHLQTTYNALLDKGQFRNAHPDWAEKIPGPAAGAPLLTLRDGRAEREPPLASVDSLSADTLLPLAPNDAWEAVATLRLQVLELQVALMNSRIQAMDGELRLQEANTIHRRYKADVRDERRQAEQSHKTAVRQLERRTNQPCVHCAHWPFKMRQLEKKTNKRIRRAEALGKCLEQVFTPMQLRVIRTGKKPRWAEEDIRRAIELKKVVSHRGYSYIRNSFKIPLPTPMIISRGAERFTALKPLFDEMVVANARKLSDNKRPGPKKDGCEVKEVRKRKTDASPAGKRPRVESSAAERPLVKRRKKRPPAPPPHPPLPPNAYEVEFVARDAPAEVVIVTSPAAAAPHRAGVAGPRGTLRPVRPSWDCARLWDDGDEQTLEELTRPRDRPAWSADTAGLR